MTGLKEPPTVAAAAGAAMPRGRPRDPAPPVAVGGVLVTKGYSTLVVGQLASVSGIGVAFRRSVPAPEIRPHATTGDHPCR